MMPSAGKRLPTIIEYSSFLSNSLAKKLDLVENSKSAHSWDYFQVHLIGKQDGEGADGLPWSQEDELAARVAAGQQELPRRG